MTENHPPPLITASAKRNNIMNLINMQLLTSPQDTILTHLIIDGQFINRRTSSQQISLLTIRQDGLAHEQEISSGLGQPT